MKKFDGRMGKLERKYGPKPRFICALGSRKNLRLVAKGLMPDNALVPATYEQRPAKRGKKGKLVRRRLGKWDTVVFMSELELAL